MGRPGLTAFSLACSDLLACDSWSGSLLAMLCQTSDVGQHIARRISLPGEEMAKQPCKCWRQDPGILYLGYSKATPWRRASVGTNPTRSPVGALTKLYFSQVELHV